MARVGGSQDSVRGRSPAARVGWGVGETEWLGLEHVWPDRNHNLVLVAPRHWPGRERHTYRSAYVEHAILPRGSSFESCPRQYCRRDLHWRRRGGTRVPEPSGVDGGAIRGPCAGTEP